MPDQEIIRLAALEKRIVITMDKDFGELVYPELVKSPEN
jgi:predicted nuclease of predicted toxin-antitoxin system